MELGLVSNQFPQLPPRGSGTRAPTASGATNKSTEFQRLFNDKNTGGGGAERAGGGFEIVDTKSTFDQASFQTSSAGNSSRAPSVHQNTAMVASDAPIELPTESVSNNTSGYGDTAAVGLGLTGVMAAPNVVSGQAPNDLVSAANVFADEMNTPADPLTHRLAIQKFLRQMDQGFNVDATQVVQAFSRLSTEELGLPAQATISRVVEELNLPPAEQGRAQALFADLTDELNAQDLKAAIRGNGRRLSLELLSQEEAAQRKLDQSLSNLAQNFFANQTELSAGPQSLNPQAQIAVSKTQNESPDRDPYAAQFGSARETQPLGQNLTSEPSSITPYGIPVAAGVTGNYAVPVGAAGAVAVSGAQQAPSATKVSIAETPEQELSRLLEDLNGSVESLNMQPKQKLSQQVPVAAKAPVAVQPNLLSPPAPVVAESGFVPEVGLMSAAALAVGSDEGNSESKLSVESSSNPETTLDLNQGTEARLGPENSQIAKSQPATSTPSAFMVGRPQASDADLKANQNDIIQHAQSLVEKGGGIMKVRLSPEGLGEVALKVTTEESGRVNVEMIASSREAKKTLELGLGDLRNQLTSQKLQIDQIKVDVASDMANQLEQQFQDQERQFAQRFMEDFRHGNSWRRNLYDIPGASRASSQTRDEADNAFMNQKLASAQRPQSQRRLNLVA